MHIIMITKKNLIIAALILAAVTVVVLLLALGNREDSKATSSNFLNVEAYELSVSTANKKELPVYSVERNDKKIALTIDAAWEDDKTDFILDTLDKYDAKATFFLCGFWVDKYPEKVKAIAERGHEIGNHSSTHPHMNALCADEIQTELKSFDDRLEKIIGKRSTLFRAPYGEYNDNVIKTVRGMGYEVIQWSIDTIDWREERSAQTILDAVLPKVKDGCIILSHNNGYKIKEYLPTLLETLKGQDYTFVTVSDLLIKGDTIIDVNGVMKQK